MTNETETLTARIAELEIENARLKNQLQLIAKERGLAKQHFEMAGGLNRALSEDGYNPQSREVLKAYPEQLERIISLASEEFLTSTPPAYSLQRLMAVVLAGKKLHDVPFAENIVKVSARELFDNVKALTPADIAFAEQFRKEG